LSISKKELNSVAIIWSLITDHWSAL